ncbi:MAG: hypothetical protein XXXJIFNMEKO3_LKCDNKCA_00130 (plasmid) [Candidatus Erwinia impunctatus]
MEHCATNVSEYIGFEIKKRRKALYISGAQLATHLGISQQQISRYERGINQPSVIMMMRIFSSLEMSESEIIKFFEPLIELYKIKQPPHPAARKVKRDPVTVLFSSLSSDNVKLRY